MESISLICPKCARRLKAPASTLGRTVKCPGCGQPFTAKAEAAAAAKPAAPGMVACEVCGGQVAESAAERFGGQLLCPRCLAVAKPEQSAPWGWKRVVGLIWDLVVAVVLVGCLIFWLQACFKPHPYNPFVMDMLIFPQALAICLPLFRTFLGEVVWWKRLVLAAVLLIDLGSGVAYGLNNEFGVLLSERAVAYVAAIVLCAVPMATGKGLVKLAGDLFARKPAKEDA